MIDALEGQTQKQLETDAHQDDAANNANDAQRHPKYPQYQPAEDHGVRRRPSKTAPILRGHRLVGGSQNRIICSSIRNPADFDGPGFAALWNCQAINQEHSACI